MEYVVYHVLRFDRDSLTLNLKFIRTKVLY